MSFGKKLLAVSGALALGLAVIAACDTIGVTGAGGDNGGSVGGVSLGRQNAARLINPAFPLRFFLAQQDLLDPMQVRCDPLGTQLGHNPWTIIADTGAAFVPSVFNNPSEYDFIVTVGETEYILGLRVPVEPSFPLFFSQVEFSLRAVNPCTNGHVIGTDYGLGQADFPSNDDVAANRSLISLTGGDVALFVAGIDFVGAPASTIGTMNFLGPTGWLVFMRDNAFRSGRFFNITGALKGGPPAFFDTPGTGDDGFFESVQVDGDNFDFFSEPNGNLSGTPDFLVCAGVPAGGKVYAFLDLSNFDELLAPGAGQGGGLFIIRREAFFGAGVVVNPNVPGPAPAPVVLADLITPPLSGYNEPIIPAIVCPGESDNSLNGPGGVHEIGWSIFFVHGG